MISPWAKVNHVDHTLTDQTSVLRFIEDNWNTGRIGEDSFDTKANSISEMFDFPRLRPLADKLILDPNSGAVTR